MNKITCLGGGSLYFPNALGDLALAEEFAGWEVVLYDIDAGKAERMAALGRRFAAEAGADLRVRATAQLADALDGARFAVSSIGGSGAEVSSNVYDSWYHNADMHIPAKYGIHQVIGDTCGPAGMMMGLRSIPAYLSIAREMERRCPDAILLNHSNPMACIMRALHKYTSITSIGVCHGVQGGIVEAARLLEVSPADLECLWIGTNHYYWFTRVRHQGRDVLPELMRRTRELAPNPHHAMSAALSNAYGFRIVYPDDSHILEFYPFATQVTGQKDLPYELIDAAHAHGYDASKPMPARHAQTPALRETFLSKYQDILDNRQIPAERDDSVTGEGLASVISAMASGRRRVCIMNIANQGAIPNLPPTAEVEIEAVTDSCGARGVHMGEAPLVLKGILEKRFVWQELVADAAVMGDRSKALQALLVDEMAVVPEKAEAMLDELLEASRDLLPQFFR